MKKIFLVGLVSFLFANSVLASGLSKPVNVGPKAIGLGGAFVGIADDPTAIYHNPAGMTQMKGHHIEIGMDALFTQEDYTPPSSAKESVDGQFLPIPQFGYVGGREKFAWGLGVFFPHGNGGKFDTPSAAIGNPNEGRIYSMEIDPAFAMEIIPGLSLGGTLRIVNVSSSLKGQLFPPGLLGPTPVTLDNLDVSGWGIGGAVGALYKPCKELSIGVNWRSQVVAGLSGDAEFTPGGVLSAKYDQTLPTLLTGGVALNLIEGLTIAASYDYERNSEIDKLDVTLNGTIPASLAQNYDDSHTIHFGTEYWVMPALALRAGYAKDLNSSIPDSTMNRVVGDIAATEVSAGVGYKWERYTFGATWNARFGSRTVPNNGTNPAPGKYEAFIHSISLGVEAAL